nr:MAG TPA: hypothetical protein [Caudoviricetes sp.]
MNLNWTILMSCSARLFRNRSSRGQRVDRSVRRGAGRVRFRFGKFCSAGARTDRYVSLRKTHRVDPADGL